MLIIRAMQEATISQWLWLCTRTWQVWSGLSCCCQPYELFVVSERSLKGHLANSHLSATSRLCLKKCHSHSCISHYLQITRILIIFWYILVSYCCQLQKACTAVHFALHLVVHVPEIYTQSTVGELCSSLQ